MRNEKSKNICSAKQESKREKWQSAQRTSHSVFLWNTKVNWQLRHATSQHLKKFYVIPLHVSENIIALRTVNLKELRKI